MLPGLLTLYFVPAPFLAAAWLVVASFPSAWIGSKLPYTNVLIVEHQSKLLKSSERKAAEGNLQFRWTEHQTWTWWGSSVSTAMLTFRVYLSANTIITDHSPLCRMNMLVQWGCLRCYHFGFTEHMSEEKWFWWILSAYLKMYISYFLCLYKNTSFQS